jgi:hypothetical protein
VVSSTRFPVTFVLAFGSATDIASVLLLDPRVAECIEVVALALPLPGRRRRLKRAQNVAAWQICSTPRSR